MVSSVLNQLSALVVEEANLLGGFGVEIQHVVDELGHMKAFLMFAEGREEENPKLEEWISQVKDVAYDLQDVLDEFLQRCSRHQGHGFYGQARKILASMKNLPGRHQFANEMKAIKSRITSISESQKRYQSEYGASNQVSASSMAVNISWCDYGDGALLVVGAKLVGIDHTKKQLISQLLDADSRLKVVSVLGQGGSGKTTLVKKVQEDVNVKRKFQILAWVTISKTFRMEELLKDLIKQLYKEIQKPVPQQVARGSINELKVLVKEFLQHRRYLIVFDDVWDSKFWDVIKLAFPEGSCGNRVILATRTADTAPASNVEFLSYVHQMQPLSSDDSWTLLCNKVFKDGFCPAYLEDVAKAILERCEGLPLAIVIIGGLLSALKDKNNMDEWKMVERSLGELDISGKLDPVTKVLSLSYNELPYHLKACLLYASIYPKDYSMEEARLIRLWIAEGFVLETTRVTKSEVARAYLYELINRNLIQVRTAPSDPSFREYHISDVLQDIILSKSGKQNFAAIGIGEERRWPRKVRRLAIHDFRSYEMQRIGWKYLRYLIFFKSKVPLSKSFLSELLCRCSRLLKVLDLEGTQLEEIPEEVFGLFRLRILSLKSTSVSVIPKSIGSLKNLEYLDLSYTNVSKLPEEILKIEGLVHLVVFCLDATTLNGFKGPKSISKLLSLEWLFCIEANEILVREIGELKKLKLLSVNSLRREYGKQLCSSLANLSDLEDLCLEAENHEILDLEDMSISFCSSLQNLQRLSLRGNLVGVPQFVSYLHGLTALELCLSRLKGDPLEPLQHLPNLMTLCLNQTFEGESLCFKTGCFLKLESLRLVRLDSLRRLRVEEGAMPNLGRLEMSSLKLLEGFPWGFEHLTKLQYLYLGSMSDKVITQVQNLDEDNEAYKKVSHIPRIMIWDRKDGWCCIQLTSYGGGELAES